MIILFILLLVCIVLGMSIFSSIGVSVFGYAMLNDVSLNSLIQQMIRGIDSFVLVSVPAFILAGNIMNGGGITKRLFHFADCMVGSIKGGLAHTNVLCSLIFAGMSGSAIADAGGLGSIEIKAMKDNGYPPEFSTAVTATSSIIGPIIPPSIPAVMFAASGCVSVGRLFMAGFIPGLVMAVGMMIMIYVMAVKRNYGRSTRATFKEKVSSFFSAFWALLTPVILLGGIFLGIVTPTEAAGIAVVYALIVSKFVYKELTLKRLYKIILESMITSAVVGIIIAMSFGLSYVLTISQVPQKMAAYITGLTSNPLIILMIMNVVFFILGMFMDPTASILIITPILMPIVSSVGIDPIHFGIVMILNLMIGMLTPPVGMCLYTVASIGNVTVDRLIKEMMPFYLLLLIVLMIVTFFPQITLFLPNLLMGKA